MLMKLEKSTAPLIENMKIKQKVLLSNLLFLTDKFSRTYLPLVRQIVPGTNYTVIYFLNECESIFEHLLLV